jgi:uncharacterized protein Smg (DUF494 family)
MLMDSHTDYHCSKNELICFSLIETHAEGDQVVQIHADVLEDEMEEYGIKPKHFDGALRKMELFMVIHRQDLEQGRYIYINSSAVHAARPKIEKSILAEKY